jgi:hypothetical protein
MTEATSHCFIAKISAAPPDVEARLVQWASANCQAHCVSRDGDSRVSLYLRRKEAKTARAMQSLIRTLTARWDLPLGDLGKGWLELCAEEDFQAAACAAGGEGPRAHADPPQSTEQAFVSQGPGPCAETAAQRADGNGVALLLSLSPDFDRRAREMYESLLVAQTAH